MATRICPDCGVEIDVSMDVCPCAPFANAPLPVMTIPGLLLDLEVQMRLARDVGNVRALELDVWIAIVAAIRKTQGEQATTHVIA